MNEPDSLPFNETVMVTQKNGAESENAQIVVRDDSPERERAWEVAKTSNSDDASDGIYSIVRKKMNFETLLTQGPLKNEFNNAFQMFSFHTLSSKKAEDSIEAAKLALAEVNSNREAAQRNRVNIAVLYVLSILHPLTCRQSFPSESNAFIIIAPSVDNLQTTIWS